MATLLNFSPRNVLFMCDSPDTRVVISKHESKMILAAVVWKTLIYHFAFMISLFTRISAFLTICGQCCF